jgi:ADP-ribosylglycohydrolase
VPPGRDRRRRRPGPRARRGPRLTDLPRRPTDARLASRFRGCLLAGACGDALGAPVEFLTLAEIRDRFGPAGIRDHVPAYGRTGAITDDTQMTLFTADGLLRAHVRSCLRSLGPAFTALTAHAYLRWLGTQDDAFAAHVAGGEPGWLIGHRDLFNKRAPGRTCVSALRQLRSVGDVAENQSKGCGGVMRVAPVGLFFARAAEQIADAEARAFQVGADVAHLTHGHPSGYLGAGAMAVLVYGLARGEPLTGALERALARLAGHDGHAETTAALHRAAELAVQRPHDVEALQRLGAGWVAEEALAIAVYCALSAPDLESAVVLAVNHGGDSDSTGAITGSLLGARDGVDAIPGRWLADLELRDVIAAVADDLAAYPDWRIGEYAPGPETDFYWRRYPGV